MSPLIRTAPQDTVTERLIWAALAILAVAQVVAFYLLCSAQVDKARDRDATLRQQRVAVSDCLQASPRATIISCAARLAGESEAAVAAARPTTQAVVPVNDVYR